MGRMKLNAIAVGLVLFVGLLAMQPMCAADPPAPNPADLLAQANALSASADKDRDAGDAEKALKQYWTAEDLFKKAAGSNDTEDISNCLNNQATCLGKLNRDADALPLYKSALEIEQRLHKNQDDPEVAIAISNEAECLLALDRAADALPLYESALKMQRRLSKNKDSADVASSMDDVARCLAKLDRDADALPLYKSSMEMQQRLHENKDDPEVATAIDSFAICLMSLDHNDDALPLAKSAMEMRRRLADGKDTPELSSGTNRYGQCLHRIGKDADAIPIYKTALEIDNRLYDNKPADHTAIVMANLVDSLLALDRSEEALPLAKSGLDIRRTLSDGKQTDDVSRSMRQLAQCLKGVADKHLTSAPVDALKEYKEANELFAKSVDSGESSDVVECLNQQGLCLHLLDREVEALPIYQQALKMGQKVYGDQPDPNIASILDNIGDCLMNLGQYPQALPIRESELKMRKELAKNADDAEIASVEKTVGFCLNSLGRYEDALSHFQAAVEMRKRLSHNQDNAEVVFDLNNVAKCEDQLGRSDDALVVYQSALEIAKRLCKNQDDADLATVMNNTAGCFESLGHGDEAFRLFSDALAMRKRIYKSKDSADIAASLNDLGTCLRMLGKEQDALKSIHDSFEMLMRINHGIESEEIATTLDNLAGCLDDRDRCVDALPIHQLALEIQLRLTKGADHPMVAKSFMNLAACEERLGQRDRALADQKEALAILHRVYKNADHPDVAVLLSNTATTLNNLDRFNEALPLYQQALDMSRRLYKERDHPTIATDMGLVGGCLISLNRPGDALPKLTGALEMQSRIHSDRSHPIIAWHMAKVGKCLSALGRKPEAISMFKAAVDMARRLNDPELFKYSTYLGDSLRSTGEFAKAAEAYDLSISAFEEVRKRTGGEDQDRMDFLDSERDECDPFLSMVGVQISLNRPDVAAEYLDRGRARSLLDVLERGERLSGADLLTPVRLKAEQTHDDNLLAEVRSTQKDLADAEDAVGLLTSQMNLARMRSDPEGRALLQQLQPKLDEACRIYADIHSTAVTLAGNSTFTGKCSAAQMQSLLKPRQHLLMYSVADQDVVAILVPPSGQAITAVTLLNDDRSKLSGIALTKMVGEYRLDMIRHGSATRGARLVHDETTTRQSDNMGTDGYELFRQLLPSEIWNQIKGDELVYVVPDSMTADVPLETLMVSPPKSPSAADRQYVLDQGPSFCYGSSAAALLKLCQRNAGISTRHFSHEAVLLGDPILQRDFPSTSKSTTRPAGDTRSAYLDGGALSPLPGTRAEVTGIYSALTGRAYSEPRDESVVVLLGEDADDRRLLEAVSGARYVHLATHGIARSGEDALYSCVVLTQPRGADQKETGTLTLQELFDHWGGKLDSTELVVLSACNSQGNGAGSSRQVADEGVFGLPWGFWYAGCPTVVASLWEVQDDSTAKLMQGFYRQMRATDGKAKLAAFTAARKELKKEYPEPFFWAPFIYLGNPN